jgi:succinate dehydrogenase flavin-adding protein (antitoxin of CptAB toxin-antitoxin module)
MAAYFELPENKTKAKARFQQLLELPDETLVLVLGNDQIAEEAREKVQQIVDANAENNDLLAFVNFLAVPNPEIIFPQLKELDNKTGELLDNLDEYVILSVSPFRNILAEAVTKKRFQKGKGSITTAILKALALG